MTILSRAVAGASTRSTSTLQNPSAELRQALGATSAIGGRSVSVEGSLGLVPVYSAISLIADAIGSLPVGVSRRRPDGGIEAHPAHATDSLIRLYANPWLPAAELWTIVAASLAAWGNAFVLKATIGGKLGLYPIRPDRVQVGRDEHGPYFLIDGKEKSKGVPFSVADILHVRGFSFDGLLGYSPIQLARQALSTGLTLDEFAGRFWQNNAQPGVILKHPNRLDDEAAKRLKASWDSAHGGIENLAKTAVLEEGMDVEVLGMPLGDAQLVEQLRLTDIRVAQLFHIPPSLLLANPGTSLTYSTTEGQGIDFLRWTLRPYLRRIETALLADPTLFPEGGDRLLARFETTELLRMDTKTRGDYARGLVKDGLATPNEGRGIIGLNPIEDPDANKLREPMAPQLAPAGGSTDKGGAVA